MDTNLMDTTLIVGSAAAIGTAWVLGRTDRPGHRAMVRAQEYAVVRKDLARLRAEADDARQESATARTAAGARAGELADANAALGRVQALADRLFATDPAVAEEITAAITGRQPAPVGEVAA